MQEMGQEHIVKLFLIHYILLLVICSIFWVWADVSTKEIQNKMEL